MNDPYPIYAQLRNEAPVYHIEQFDAWAISKFQGIWDLSKDNKHFTATKGTTSAHVLTKVQPVTPMLNMMDPPEHTRMRSAMRAHFTPANVAYLEPFIRDMAKASIAAGADGVIVEVHPNPDRALSDGYQSLNFKQFNEMMSDCRQIADAIGRTLGALA